MNEISFAVTGEYIELVKLLKVCGVCDTGGSAKVAVLQGEVRVDGEVETRKGRKIRPGQRVEVGDAVILVK